MAALARLGYGAFAVSAGRPMVIQWTAYSVAGRKLGAGPLRIHS